MRAYLTTGIIGSLAFDEKGKLLSYKLFKKDPEEIAEKFSRTQSKEIVEEEKELINTLIKKGFKEIVWDKEAVFPGVKTICEPENIAKRTLQQQFRKLALDLKFVSRQDELNKILTQVSILRAKTKLREPKKDLVIMHVIGIIDELDRDLNIFSERLREWYGLHFPEAGKIKSNEQYAQLIAKYGRRENISERELKKLAGESAGMPFKDSDIKAVREFSASVLGLFEEREKLAKYLEEATKEATPNISAIAGPLLSARLLVLAGGLEKMARLPSSTIQILGAEKALFRHLREKAKVPKFGVLFAHPLIQQAPKNLKGKIARLIAAKISLAAKIDHFSKEDRGEKLKKDLEKQVKKVLG